MENNTIKITNENGEIKEAEVVLCFEKDGKKFAIYTFNEKDSNDTIILYSSIIEKESGKNVFKKMADDDWNMVKQMMNSIVKEWEEQ